MDEKPFSDDPTQMCMTICKVSEIFKNNLLNFVFQFRIFFYKLAFLIFKNQMLIFFVAFSQHPPLTPHKHIAFSVLPFPRK